MRAAVDLCLGCVSRGERRVVFSGPASTYGCVHASVCFQRRRLGVQRLLCLRRARCPCFRRVRQHVMCDRMRCGRLLFLLLPLFFLSHLSALRLFSQLLSLVPSLSLLLSPLQAQPGPSLLCGGRVVTLRQPPAVLRPRQTNYREVRTVCVTEIMKCGGATHVCGGEVGVIMC